MNTLIRPADHVEELFGKRPLLVYGDINGDSIIIYSTQTSPGYLAEGDVYSKSMSLQDPLIWRMRGTLTEGRAYVYPRKVVTWRSPNFEREESLEFEPSEELRLLFGVRGSFGYIPSAAIVNYFYPNARTMLKELSPDIFLSHEGTHVVSLGEIDLLFLEYEKLLSKDVMSEEVRRASFHEAVAFWSERRYIQHHHPIWLDVYDAWRSSDEEMHVEYREANRLLRREPEKIKELVSRIKEIIAKDSVKTNY